MIGAIGTFVTGSDTSSNVLFGNLQPQVAIQLGANQELLTAGKMISPQSISIATAAIGWSGSEGKIFGATVTKNGKTVTTPLQVIVTNQSRTGFFCTGMDIGNVRHNPFPLCECLLMF